MPRPILPLLILSFLFVTATRSQAAISISNAGGYLAITVDSPITFTLTGSTDAYTRVVVEDFFASDVSNGISGAPVSGSAPLSIPSSFPTIAWGTAYLNLGIYDLNDLVLSWSSNVPSLSPGSLVTVSPGTVITDLLFSTLPPVSAATSFTAYLTNNYVESIANPLTIPAVSAIVPEPGKAGLLALAPLFALTRRRRLVARAC